MIRVIQSKPKITNVNAIIITKKPPPEGYTHIVIKRKPMTADTSETSIIRIALSDRE